MKPKTHQTAATHKTLEVVCAIVVHNGKVRCAQRGPAMPHAGFWEFPGGKIHANESPEAALQRELLEELHCVVAIGAALPEVQHSYDGALTISLKPYYCTLQTGAPIPTEHAQIIWLLPTQLHSLNWVAADVKVVEAVAEGFV